MTDLPTIGFWRRLDHWGNRTALIDARTSERWSYSRLHDEAQSIAESMRSSTKGLVFVYAQNDPCTVVGYLAALIAGHTVFLTTSPGALLDEYQPELLFRKQAPLPSGYDVVNDFRDHHLLRRSRLDSYPPHGDLGLLLATSASTGSAKLARLSYQSVAIAAGQVTQALSLSAEERAITSLPLTHVYGLSVLNSHLHAGGSIVLNTRSPADQGFWSSLSQHRVTNLAGVSATYEFMRRNVQSALSLRKLTHSGDRLAPGTVAWLRESVAASLYLMYGQTETGGRISVLPPHRVAEHPDSVGQAVARGELSISAQSEVVYRGPNVMLGYATTREDLRRGDETGGVVQTGDLGRLDAEGLLYLTGRVSRSCKVFGRRLSLDDVEAHFARFAPVAAIDHGGGMVLFTESPVTELGGIALDFARRAHLPPQCISIRNLSALPRTEAGKVSYAELRTLCGKH
jgi:acyl-CoA synthetase (AMP-forming)/AMP-acid ligase II